MPETLTIPLPTVESAITLAGAGEANLKILAKQTGAQWVLRGQELVIVGTAAQVDQARQLVAALEPDWRRGKPIGPVDILTVVQALASDRAEDLRGLQADVLARNRAGS
jgi:phosphate starvation-inducible protein PhoH and related proteins